MPINLSTKIILPEAVKKWQQAVFEFVTWKRNKYPNPEEFNLTKSSRYCSLNSRDQAFARLAKLNREKKNV